VEADPVLPRQRRRLPHQLRRHRERGAGGEHDLEHRPRCRVVVALDHAQRVGQNRRLLLDAVVRRQPPLRFAERHAAAGGDEADPDLGRRPDLVVDPAAVLEQVGVVENGRAAGQRQLGAADDNRGPGVGRRPARPHPVVGAQPREEVGVLPRRQVPGQHLIQVVVAVDQPRQQDLPAQIEHDVGLVRQIRRRPDPLDDPIPREQRAAGDLPPPIVHRHHELGILASNVPTSGLPPRLPMVAPHKAGGPSPTVPSPTGAVDRGPLVPLSTATSPALA
jgi:hypothetical protein